MTVLYPIVLETEESGAVSAYVPGLPVYAAADSHAKAEWSSSPPKPLASPMTRPLCWDRLPGPAAT